METSNSLIKLEKAKCVICDSDSYQKLFSIKDFRYHVKGTFTFVRCKSCGLVYLNPKPRKSEIGKAYPASYYSPKYPPPVNYVARVFGKLSLLLLLKEVLRYKKNGRILDVGCGKGDLLLAFKERNWETYGIEISETAYKIAKSKIGRNIQRCELIECGFPSEFFDVVTLIHVVEHLYDPNIELKEINRILKKDGVLIIETPNIESYEFEICGERWIGLDPPRHLHLFSPKTITLLLQKHGFEILKIKGIYSMPLSIFYSLREKYPTLRKKHVLNVFLLLFSIFIKFHPKRGNIRIIARKVT